MKSEKILEEISQIKNKIINFAIQKQAKDLKIEKINIMIFSCMGAGSSSFVNSTMSSLKNKYVSKATTSDKMCRCTTTITKYKPSKENS